MLQTARGQGSGGVSTGDPQTYAAEFQTLEKKSSSRRDKPSTTVGRSRLCDATTRGSKPRKDRRSGVEDRHQTLIRAQFGQVSPGQGPGLVKRPHVIFSLEIGETLLASSFDLIERVMFHSATIAGRERGAH
jgi:hypothetical protein